MLSAERPLRVKFGIDATRDRLHLGHFVPLRIARKLQEQGHELHLVLGTITGQLGDPSGRDTTRPVLDEGAVRRNGEGLLERLLPIVGEGVTIHWNHEIAGALSLPVFLTRLAATTTVAHMLSRDGFRRRTAAGASIGLHELLVPLLQGWDSVVIDADVEIGGSDQLFNFQVARHLQASEGQTPEVALMTGILVGTDGRKMSKSFDNCVWIDEAPFDLFGQVMAVSDEVAEQWLPIVSDLESPPAEPMARKLALAEDIVRQIRGFAPAREARERFEREIRRGEVPADVPEVGQAALVDLVVAHRGGSRSAARRLVEGGGIRVDGHKVVDPEGVPAPGSVVRLGRRCWVRIGAGRPDPLP